jgi:hypothetical protein
MRLTILLPLSAIAIAPIASVTATVTPGQHRENSQFNHRSPIHWSFAHWSLVIRSLVIRSLLIHFPLRAGDNAAEDANDLIALLVKAVGFRRIADLGGLTETQPEAGFTGFLTAKAKAVKEIATGRHPHLIA